MYCKSGKSPYLCGGECNACFSQSVYTAYFCDKCGAELIYDDEKSLCRGCMKKSSMKKIKSESEESVWTQAKA